MDTRPAQQELEDAIEAHARWLKDADKGSQTDLRHRDLWRATISGAKLSYALMSWADLFFADLSGTDLSHAELIMAQLPNADLSGANLTQANLLRANMLGANLTGANLSGARIAKVVGNMREIKTLVVDTYVVTYTAERMYIDATEMSLAEWRAKTDEEIPGIDAEWWAKWKDIIFQIIDMSPAVPT